MNKECVIISYGESQGVYIDAKDVKNIKSQNLDYAHKLVQKLVQDGKNVSFYHTNSLQLNKLHHIKDILIYNVDYETIKKLQIQSIEYNQRKCFGLGKLFIRDSMKPKINSDDKNQRIRDLLKNSTNPIVLWSGGANDIMYYINNNPLKAIYAPHTVSNSLDRMDSAELKELLKKEIKDNIESIYAINPHACVIALGYYPPKVLHLSKRFINILDVYNKIIEQTITEYGGIYIPEDDLSKYCGVFNFHINEEGHEKLASRVYDEYNSYLDENHLNKLEQIEYQMQLFQNIKRINIEYNSEYCIKSRIYDLLITLKNNDSNLWTMVYDICLRIEELSKDNNISERERKFKLVQKMDEIKSILNVYDNNKKTYKFNL